MKVFKPRKRSICVHGYYNKNNCIGCKPNLFCDHIKKSSTCSICMKWNIAFELQANYNKYDAKRSFYILKEELRFNSVKRIK